MLKCKQMKRPSTTPVSKGIVTKSAIVAAAVVVGITTTLAPLSRPAAADKWDDQMNALRVQMNQFQAQADALNAQANTLQAELDQITGQKNAIIAQIDISQKQLDSLQAQIEETTQKIADNRDALGKIIADMYVDDSISPIEMLASANNIGDYIDKQEYRESIQDNLTRTIDEINALKKRLEDSKKEVEVVIEQQKGQRAELASKEAEQQLIVDKTRGDEAAYQSLVNDAQAQMASAAEQQRAYYDSLRAQSGGVFTSGVIGTLVITQFNGNQGRYGGGYPYGNAPYPCWNGGCVDPWQLYYRECVSYAAWRIANVYGRSVKPFAGSGMAYQWEWAGPRYSGAYAVSNPQPGDAVVAPIGPGMPVGHLMVVEGVTGDNVLVSQYNFGSTGEYSTMTISKSRSNVIYLRFP